MVLGGDLFVLGATGQQGYAVAEEALRRGFGVRTFVRNSEAPRAHALRERGAKTCVGDLDDTSSLDAACEGAAGVFFALPSEEGTAVEQRRGFAVIEAAKRAGARHIVYSSAASSDRDIPVPHIAGKRAIEQRLAQLTDVAWNVVAPVYFMENNVSGFAMQQLHFGKVTRFFSPERRVQQVALSDVAAMVLHLFENRDSLSGRRIELAGDSVSSADIARTLGARLRRELIVEQLPDSVLPEGSEFLSSVKALVQWLETDGFSVDLEQLKTDYPKVTWTDFAAWADRQNWEEPQD